MSPHPRPTHTLYVCLSSLAVLPVPVSLPLMTFIQNDIEKEQKPIRHYPFYPPMPYSIMSVFLNSVSGGGEVSAR